MRITPEMKNMVSLKSKPWASFLARYILGGAIAYFFFFKKESTPVACVDTEKELQGFSSVPTHQPEDLDHAEPFQLKL
jgi:hypothetical protein